jgi:hypothetical protein
MPLIWGCLYKLFVVWGTEGPPRTKFIKTLSDLELFCNDCRACGTTNETEVNYDFTVSPYIVLEADNEGKLQINFYDGGLT